MNILSKESLSKIINNILKDQIITPQRFDDDFENYGVDSISFIKIIVSVEDAYNIEIPDSKLIYSELNSVNKMFDTILPLVYDYE